MAIVPPIHLSNGVDTLFDKLDDEILAVIFSQCDCFDYFEMLVVSRRWCRILKTERVCHALYLSCFARKVPDEDASLSWRQLLSKRCAMLKYVVMTLEAPDVALRWLCRGGHERGLWRLVCQLRRNTDVAPILNSISSSESLLNEVVASRLSVELLLALVGAGADPNLAGFKGRTALHVAAYHGYIELVEALLTDCGANPYALESSYRQTAMHVAASAGQLAAVRALHARCPDLYTVLDRDRYSVLRVAAEKHREVPFFLSFSIPGIQHLVQDIVAQLLEWARADANKEP